MKFNIKIWIPLLLFLFLVGSGCTIRRVAAFPPMTVRLHSGIAELARLGQGQEMVLKNTAKWSPTFKPGSAIPGANVADFNQILMFPEVGVRVYFRRGYVALIEIQPPFKGDIMGKRLTLFDFHVAKWQKKIRRDFGPEKFSLVGGRLGAEAMYYSWGDISYNRSGPKEIAIYRLPIVRKYRKNNFGQSLKLF